RYAVRPPPPQYPANPQPQPQYPGAAQPQGAYPGAVPPSQGYPGMAAPHERYAVVPSAGEWTPLPLQGQAMPQYTVAPKSPATSVLLSIFIPGLGSMVNENVGVGVAILILNIVGLMLSIILIGIPLAI